MSTNAIEAIKRKSAERVEAAKLRYIEFLDMGEIGVEFADELAGVLQTLGKPIDQVARDRGLRNQGLRMLEAIHRALGTNARIAKAFADVEASNKERVRLLEAHAQKHRELVMEHEQANADASHGRESERQLRELCQAQPDLFIGLEIAKAGKLANQ